MPPLHENIARLLRCNYEKQYQEEGFFLEILHEKAYTYHLMKSVVTGK